MTEEKISKFEFYTEIDKNKEKNGQKNEKEMNPILNQKDMMFFKNEILKEISSITKEITEKNEKYDMIFNSEINKLNIFMQQSEAKIKNLINLISIDNETQKKLDILSEFKSKLESYMITNDIRYSNLEKDLSENIFRHDSILKESVIYPRIIGPSSQFKNFHDLIDYFLMEIIEILKYKEKTSADIIVYKSKIDTNIKNIKTSINDFQENLEFNIEKNFNKFNEKIINMGLKYDEILEQFKLENDDFFDNFNKKFENSEKNFDEKIKNLNEELIKIRNKIKKIPKKDNNDSQKKSFVFNKQKIISKRSFQPKEDKIIINKIKEINKNKKSDNKLAIKENESKNNTSRKNNDSSESKSKNKSKSSISNNSEMKNLEINLKKFVIEEIKKISNNLNISMKSFKQELLQNNEKKEQKEKKDIKKNMTEISLNNNNKKKESKISRPKSENKFEVFQMEESQKNIKNIKQNKKQSYVDNNLGKNIFEKFVKLKEDQKRYIFEKTKDVFIEESFESSVASSPQNSKKIRNEINKSKSNKSLTKENVILNEPEFKKDLNVKQSYNTTIHLPLVKKTKIKKEKIQKIKIDMNISKREKNNENINKNPINKKISLRTHSSQMSSRISKLDKNLNNLDKLKEGLFKQKPKLYINDIDNNYNYKENININIINNNNLNENNFKKIEIKKEINNINNNINDSINDSTNDNINHIINANNTNYINDNDNKVNNNIPAQKDKKIKNKEINKPRLSNFAITLQGAKKFNLNLNPINNLSNKNNIPNKKNLFNSPTIYMNFPRTYSLYNDRVMESLHPIYRYKKFSKYISPYISLLTNNLQDMIRKSNKKSMEQRRKNLPWNRSENVLIKNINVGSLYKHKNIQTFGNNYSPKNNINRIKLDDENNMIPFNEFKNLIMKDI